MCKLARETMGYQNFGVQVTSFERRVERSCGIQSTYAVRPCILMSRPNRIICFTHSHSFFQVYVVKVQCNTAHSWVSEKRYSDFLSFDEKLRKKFWYMEVPKLPEKEVWNFSKNTDEFLLARQKQLQTYMSTVLKTSCFSQADETWQFLTDSKTIVGVPPEALMEAAAADGSKGATNYGAIGAGGAAVAAH